MPSVIFTCEHAGHRIPAIAKACFSGRKRLLESHRGFDFGALKSAKIISRYLSAPLFICETTRLVVDSNRSPHSPEIHSKFIKSLSPQQKTKLLNEIYFPYRNLVFKQVTKTPKTTVHISVHSFTPIRNGERRTCAIGLLFDPARPEEAALNHALKNELEKEFPRLKIKMNYPYKGTDDGHTTELRSKFPSKRYIGFEIEFNQAWLKSIMKSGKFDRSMRKIAQALSRAIENQFA